MHVLKLISHCILNFISAIIITISMSDRSSSTKAFNTCQILCEGARWNVPKVAKGTKYPSSAHCEVNFSFLLHILLSNFHCLGMQWWLSVCFRTGPWD